METFANHTLQTSIRYPKAVGSSPTKSAFLLVYFFLRARISIPKQNSLRILLTVKNDVPPSITQSLSFCWIQCLLSSFDINHNDNLLILLQQHKFKIQYSVLTRSVHEMQSHTASTALQIKRKTRHSRQSTIVGVQKAFPFPFRCNPILIPSAGHERVKKLKYMTPPGPEN